MLTGSFFGRLAHNEPRWVDTTIERVAERETVAVEAGSFDTMVYHVKTGDGREGRFYVETAYPHRLIRWTLLPDIEATLAGSTRLEYWKLNRPGNESYLEALGLTTP